MKNTGKLTIVMLAVVALGMFALPSVMSVGTGQHTFINGSELNCNKCHANAADGVNNELKASTTTMYAGTVGGVPYNQGVKIHAMDNAGYVGQCRDCHKAAQVRTGVTSDDHTNILLVPTCTTCHTNVNTELAGTKPDGTPDAHANLNSTGVGNGGCLGCHTAVYVSGSPTYSYSASTYTNVRGLSIGNTSATSPGTTVWTP